ncbi:MAG: glycosyltransferase family 4 protein, partial [Acidimicrobiales bacterium]
VKAALVCTMATVGLRVPLIWVKHDFSWDGPLVKAIALRCSEVVAVSAAVTETLPRRARVSVVRLGVTPHRLDREASRRLIREMLEVRDDAPVVALVGRLHPVKGHHELLAVVPQLVERVPGVRFLLLGGEDPNHLEYGAGVRRRAEELRSAVTILGHRDDALDLIGGCDVMVVPSVRDDRGMGREGASLVTVEAMAMGTAIVAYADGGIPEVMGDCGRLVPPGDQDRLADAIAGILLDRQLADQLREHACARAAERFSLATNTEALKDRYHAVARRW